MAATCGANFAKIILIIFNIFFLIAGLCLIGVGGWLLGDKSISTPFETAGDIFGKSFLRNAAILLIFVGILIVVFTAIGLFAAITENTIALSIYIGLLILVCIGEIAGGVVAIVFKEQMIKNLYSGMSSTLEGLHNQTEGKYYKTQNSQCTSLNNASPWDFFQFNGECCGLEGPDDYKNIFKYNFDLNTTCGLTGVTTNSVPWSCCYKKDLKTIPDPKITDVDCTKKVHSNGCYEKLVFNVQRFAPVLIGIGLGFGFLQLFGIIFAVCVCQNPSKDHY